MAFRLYVDRTLTESELKEALSGLIHGDDSFRYDDHDRRPEDYRPVNFSVSLVPLSADSIRNSGEGALIFPSAKLARIFQKSFLQESGSIMVAGKKVKLRPMKIEPWMRHAMRRLETTLYILPDAAVERSRRFLSAVRLCTQTVEIGVYYRDRKGPGSSQSFSPEWSRDCPPESPAWLTYEHDHHLFCVMLGDLALQDNIVQRVTIGCGIIEEIGYGRDFGTPYIRFVLNAAPEFNEMVAFADCSQEGDSEKKVNECDPGHYWRRVASLDARHNSIARYAYQLRIRLVDASGGHQTHQDALRLFIHLCSEAGLPRPTYDQAQPLYLERKDFFSMDTRRPYRLYCIQSWLQKQNLDWPCVFQVWALLLNGLLTTEELFMDLKRPIEALKKEGGDLCADVLQHFLVALRVSNSRKPLPNILDIVRDERRSILARGSLVGGRRSGIMCHHVTLTPTRIRLEGPYQSQSNIVIDRYPGFEDHFIRVNFTDEEGNSHWYNADVDYIPLLWERFGGTLKNGLPLGGRHYEFLGYSTSSLRNHQAWYMSPFDYHGETITGEVIRQALGNFDTDFDKPPEDRLNRQPAKYAARLGQSFSATVKSIFLRKGQWTEVADLGKEPFVHTDGVGTISLACAKAIWEIIRPPGTDDALIPEVLQIRFLGYKGVVYVDRLQTDYSLILSSSMRKFKGTPGDTPDIDQEGPFEFRIAKYFNSARPCAFNRALVIIMEGLGVSYRAFQDLQDTAVANVHQIDDSITLFSQTIRAYGLGRCFHLPSLAERLQRLGLDFKGVVDGHLINEPFLNSVRRCVQLHILRNLKHESRIPIPNSFKLVGVADMGPRYDAKGIENLYVLPQNCIYACIQNSLQESPRYLKGRCTISRSPVSSIGDVRVVHAIGEPPAGTLCVFRDLKNAVVFSSEVLERSLPSCLSGGDLDGDEYDIFQEESLFPTIFEEPAAYTPAKPDTLPNERMSDVNMDDISNFFVKFIISAVVGIIADRLNIIADQSMHGPRDARCVKLAELHSEAVDFQKSGNAINLQVKNLPRTLMREKPDWHKASVDSPRNADYYLSRKALGKLYRDPALSRLEHDLEQFHERQGPSESSPNGRPDVVLKTLQPLVKRRVGGLVPSAVASQEVEGLMRSYISELRYISIVHMPSTEGLTEEELVVGTILGKCSSKRWRNERMYRIGEQVDGLVRDVRGRLVNDMAAPTDKELVGALHAFEMGQQTRPAFGASSFALVALDVVLECLDRLGDIPPSG